MSKIKDLTGRKFGRLKVIKYDGSNKYGRALWLCQCDCGNTKAIIGSSLLRGLTISCGCYNKEHSKEVHLKHKQSYSKLYKVWQAMKTRCYSKNFIYYCNYGGRGIKICDDWKKSFLKFYEWAITNGYKEELTIDRINNDDDYKPNNCRWVTRKQQNNNMRTNIFIEYNGKKQTISELADKYDLSRVALYYRLKRGWNIKKALTTPIKK